MIFKTKATYDWMVVGLGNPGLQYENTRHNAGFLAADKMADDFGFDFKKNKFESVLGECNINGKRILIVKPQTFMNNSGRAVQRISSFYKIPCNRIIIIHDDISLDVGNIRIRRKGSHGGQNGMRDIIELLGTEEIVRIKIGVGKKPHPQYDLVKWVLGRFPKENEADLKQALEKAVLSVKEIITNSIDSAMNKYNS